MFSVVEDKSLKDEKNSNLIENTYFISDTSSSSSSSSSSTPINSNIIYLTTDIITVPAFFAVENEEEIKEEEEKEIKETKIEEINKNNYLKMLSNNDNNDNLYDPITKTIYDPYKVFESETPNLSVLSPESSLCDLEGFEQIHLFDNNNYQKLPSVNNYYTTNGMDTPISHGSPATMPEESDDITSKDCIPPEELHKFSQNFIDIPSGSTTPNYNNNNNNFNYDDNNVDDDFDMEMLQPINVNEQQNNNNNNIGVKRKMETIFNNTNSPMKKKRFNNLKINTNLKPQQKQDDIMTSQILNDVIELEEKQKFITTENQMCLQSPVFDDESSNMSNNIKFDFHQNILNTSSPILDVGTENSQNNILLHNIYHNRNINNSIEESHTSLSLQSSSINTNLSNNNNIEIKEENPPSVASSDDYTYSTSPTTPLSCQPKRRRGRPRIEHRLEPTQRELKNLSEHDKKVKLLRVRNNKASQVSRDKKRNKQQYAEIELMLQEKENRRLKIEFEKHDKILTIYKNALEASIKKKF